MSYSVAFTTPSSTPPWKRWLVLSPVARIVIYFACFFAAGYGLSHLVAALGLNGRAVPSVQRALISLVVQLIAILLVYVILVRWLEQRRVTELSLRKLPANVIIGLIAGFLLLSAMTGLLWLFGSYHVMEINPAVAWLPPLLTIGIATGIAEETICRGVLYRVSEEGLGTWWALVISALFFGGAHLQNPNATLWSALAIAIEAGILLALIYNLTRSLWMVIGVHAAWNFSEGVIYGIPVSGFDMKGFIVPTFTGPDWLTGGKFGIEASVVSVVLSAAISAVLLVVALRRGTIVPPAWVRRRKGLA